MTKSDYEKNSITLSGAVAMGTGVMISAGISALTGQIAELAGPLRCPILYDDGHYETGADTAKLDEPVDGSKQVIRGDMILQREVLE